MNIGEFSDSFLPIVDGVGRVVYHYAVTLTEKGHDCYVITPSNDTGYRGRLPFEIVDFAGVPVPGSPQYRAGIAVLDRHYYERLRLIPLDIVHAHDPFTAGQEAFRIAMRRDIPLVGTFHSKYYDDFYKATGKVLAAIGVRYVVDFYERCDEVWAVSQSSADVLHDYGYRGDVIVMPNGTELRDRRAEDLELINTRFRLGDDKPVLLFVGQINWKKNILRILEAAALLKARGASFWLVLAGQGPDEDDVLAKVKELSLEDSTVFTGHLRETALLDGLYQRASLFVFPSIYDNAPMVLREAAAMGTPSVLTRGSCAAEAVNDGENGLLAEDSSEDLANVLLQNLSDAARLNALGEAARKTIAVPWDGIIDKALERYRALVEASKSEDVQKRRAVLRSTLMDK
ncbi:MAG: glycosyltransferase [Clostridiaceae bacterium]|nr:glycosyltransferase [Eubacteriales bacterium]